MDFVRRLEPQSLPGAPVELIVHFRDLLVADLLEWCPFWKVLPQEPVGVLVGPALPWMVREREAEPRAELVRYLGMGRELLSPVWGYGFQRLPGEGRRDHPVRIARLPGFRLAADEQPAPPIRRGREARAARLAGDGAGLPVPEPPADGGLAPADLCGDRRQAPRPRRPCSCAPSTWES